MEGTHDGCHCFSPLTPTNATPRRAVQCRAAVRAGSGSACVFGRVFKQFGNSSARRGSRQSLRRRGRPGPARPQRFLPKHPFNRRSMAPFPEHRMPSSAKRSMGCSRALRQALLQSLQIPSKKFHRKGRRGTKKPKVSFREAGHTLPTRSYARGVTGDCFVAR